MANVKYHAINIIAILLFSFVVSITINDIIKYFIFDTTVHSKAISGRKSRRAGNNPAGRTPFSEYEQAILNSGFFKSSDEPIEFAVESGEEPPEVELSQLELVGTITGPYRIARALIHKRGGASNPRFNRRRAKTSRSRALKNFEVFKLWSDVYGYKLVSIRMRKVYLKYRGEYKVLKLWEKKKKKEETGKKNNRSASPSGSGTTKTISRAWLQQKVFNNIDNALKGLRAGPYRVGGKIEGYRLKRVRPSSILYKLGARRGDIIKRINGHKVSGTNKLFKLWQNLKNENKIDIDLERRKKMMHFTFNITD